MRILTPEMAMSRLAASCARTETCTADAMARLKRWGITPSAASAIIGRLTDESYISDSRYAQAYVRDKYRFAGWGRRKIALGLAAKRIARDIAAEALDEAVDSDEYLAKLTAVVRAKARTMPRELHNTYEGRAKLFAFAAGRGFESSLITAVIRSTDNPVWPDPSSDD